MLRCLEKEPELRYPDGDRVITSFLDFIAPAQPTGPDGRFRKMRLPAGLLKGTARFTPPGGAQSPTEMAFDVTIANGAEATETVELP